MNWMSWLRVILDGFMMSIYFNLATGLVMVIDPVIFTTSYPDEIQKIAPKNPKAMKHKKRFTLFVILPVLLYGVISAYQAGITGFWTLALVGYVEWFFVNLGDFFGLDLYLREKMGHRLQLPGTWDHPCYKRNRWMRSLAIPEHWVLWPLIICPVFALASAGLGLLLR